VLAQLLPGTVEARLHGGNTRAKNFGNLRVTTPLLHEGKQSPVLRAELSEGVSQGVEFLRVYRSRGFRDVLVLVRKGQEDPPEALPPQLVDASVARQAEKPRFELGRRLQAVDRADHLDEDLLTEVLDDVAPVGHRKDKARHAVLVRQNELTLSGLVAPLGPTHQLDQCRG
jgi:hypothetical protein